MSTTLSGDSDRFVITRGVQNVFVFTIKQDGSTLPITIDASDTFEARLMEYTDGAPITINTTALTVVDANSGKVQLTYSEAMSSALPTKKGGVEDRYYSKPLYYLVLVCNTLANGYFIARVNKVYVE